MYNFRNMWKNSVALGLFVCLSCLFYFTFKNLSELERKEEYK